MHEIVHLWDALLHWLAVQTGTYIPPGQYSDHYNFWSGFGSDIGEVAIIGGLVQIVRHTNCHVKGCWRFGKFPFKHYKLCRRHHPSVPQEVTHNYIKKLHKSGKIG